MVAVLACLCAFGSVALIGVIIYPPLAERFRVHVHKRAQTASVELSDIFVNLSHARLQLLYGLSPVAVGLVIWMLTGLWIMGVLGLGVGLVFPQFVLRSMRALRSKQFHDQFVDSLLLLSSSLRAGLSMVQSFTVIAEEMPPPISQEFGLVLKEIRMGVNVDEAMVHLKQRMPSDDTTLFVTAVLVARETGGDVTAIFAKLVETLRDRKRLKERVKTLTFMAKMQGGLMGGLPFLFAYAVYQMDKNHFTFFLSDPVGKMLMMLIAAFWVVSMLLFMRFGRSPL
jgi:tight adherence protein B